MKSFLSILISVFCQLSLTGQWSDFSLLTSSTLNSVHFLNEEIGLVCGDSSIWKTENGGEDWQEIYSGIYQEIEDIKWIDGQKIIAVGSSVVGGVIGNIILKSEDGGDNWESIANPASGRLVDVHFIDDNLGFIAGSNVVLKTTNGGNDWVLVFGTGSSLRAVYFINSTKGFLVGGGSLSSVMFITNDGGSTWDEVMIAGSSFLQSIHFPSNSIGYVVGWNGQIFKTDNGGVDWQPQIGVNMNGNLDVYFLDDHTGYVVGGTLNSTSIQFTEDGGATWSEEAPVSFFQGLTSLHFPSPKIGYAVGANGTVLKKEIINSIFASSAKESIITVFPNPTTNSMYVQSKINTLDKITLFSGQRIIQEINDINKLETVIDVSNLSAGIYYLNIESANLIETKIITKY